ncbi:hypothetical protein AAG906_005360 [Vitis piasezkii]
MLGGFGKVEHIGEQDETEKNKAPAVDDPVDPDENEDFDATQRQIIDAQSHLNSLIASYNRDVKVLRTRFTSSQYRIDEGQPSNFHEHVNESGAPFYTNNQQDSPIHYGGQRRSSKMTLDVQMKGVERPNIEDGVLFSNEDPFTWATQYVGEETHVADYVFDESKDPSEMLCAYGGYGMTRNNFNVISMFCRYMNAKEDNPSRRHFLIHTLGCHIGMYAILYMQHWDGSGLNRTINSLERLKFATHMVLDSENEIGEMEVTDKLIEEDEFDADQKDAFKNFVKDNVREAKKANRQAREAQKGIAK